MQYQLNTKTKETVSNTTVGIVWVIFFFIFAFMPW